MDNISPVLPKAKAEEYHVQCSVVQSTSPEKKYGGVAREKPLLYRVSLCPELVIVRLLLRSQSDG